MNLGDQPPHRREPGGEPQHAAGVARADEQTAARLGQQREDLAVIELGDRGRLLAAVADFVKLALGPGPDP